MPAGEPTTMLKTAFCPLAMHHTAGERQCHLAPAHPTAITGGACQILERTVWITDIQISATPARVRISLLVARMSTAMVPKSAGNRLLCDEQDGIRRPGPTGPVP